MRMCHLMGSLWSWELWNCLLNNECEIWLYCDCSEPSNAVLIIAFFHEQFEPKLKYSHDKYNKSKDSNETCSNGIIIMFYRAHIK